MDPAIRQDFSRALELHEHGDLAAAEAGYRALYARAAHPKIAHALALALYQQQRLDDAIAWFERAGEGASGPRFHVNFASALLAAGRPAEAEAESRAALAQAPEHAGARLNLALAHEAQQRFDAAAQGFTALTGLPDVAAVARRGLARSLMRAGRLAEAREALAQAGGADDPEVALVRGELSLENGDFDEAQSALDIAAAAETTRDRASLVQARLAALRRDSDTAIALLERAFAAGHRSRTALLQATQLLLERGEVARCLDRLQEWLDAHPGDAEMHSVYLRCAQFSTEFDAARLLEAHRHWAKTHAPPAERVEPRSRSAGEALRVGWLSPAFRNSPVQTFLLATLRELEQRGLCENVLYDCGRKHEPSSVAFRAACRRWCDVGQLDDRALVERIRDDRVDVLVDLAGHAGGGRLVALALRAPPAQVTWLDSFGTTGIDAMDFVLTDSICTPAGSEADFVEKPLFLPRGRLCYEPPVPARRPDPAARRLVSLNYFAKLNDAVIALWAQILRALPDWTFALKSRGGDDPGVVSTLHARFARHGVDPARVECSGYASVPEALALYRDAGIALDPFPFSGGANSCDALWMGLPLVTLPHDTLVSRQGASLLHAVGRPEWIARDAKDYVAIACALAADRTARERWSEVAAAQVHERLCDAGSFAADLIDAFARAWRLRAQEDFCAVSRREAQAAAAACAT